jgi:predicted RNA-binding protein associated with RNAse of E/G family
MYRQFNNEDSSVEDQDLIIFKNIKRSGLHAIVARPSILPYNDAFQWVYVHLDDKKKMIINEADRRQYPPDVSIANAECISQ